MAHEKSDPSAEIHEILRAVDAKAIPEIGDEPVDWLVSLAGYSPGTTAFAFDRVRPKNLLVIHTEETKENYNLLAGILTAEKRIPFSNLRHAACNPTDARSIYEETRKQIPSSNTKQRIMIDITGGKKVMSATAALAAWQLDFEICYVESEYDPVTRKPVPGTTELILIDNPKSLFGDDDIKRAEDLFDAGAYSAAHTLLTELADRVLSPEPIRGRAHLAKMYEYWIDLEFTKAVEEGNRAYRTASNGLKKHGNDQLQRQIALLQEMGAADQKSSILCFYALGKHFQEQHRYDFAVLFFYRALEAVFVDRLVEHYKVDQRNADYIKLGVTEDQLLVVSQNINPTWQRRGLAPDLGFINSLVLLKALDDERISALEAAEGQDIIKVLYNLSLLRNDSVLAHGFKTITKDDAEPFRERAKATLEVFLGAQVKQSMKDLTFLKFANQR